LPLTPMSPSSPPPLSSPSPPPLSRPPVSAPPPFLSETPPSPPLLFTRPPNPSGSYSFSVIKGNEIFGRIVVTMTALVFALVNL
jgi:hypothetical protein